MAESREKGPRQTLTAVVRHGCSSCRTTCSVPEGTDAKRGDAIVARTSRGVEWALILTDPAEPEAGAPRPQVEMLREATPEDTAQQKQIDTEGRSEEFRFCRERLEERALPMTLARVEKLLGGGRLIFYFHSEERVDFRDLVRDLSARYRMRIELKQVGARDEAKILGDVSYCGRELCCSSWIREMKPISMRMAKNQKSTLDPAKISGMCGRLLCCLRYEDEVYTELRKALPKRGTRVEIPATNKSGMVLHQEVLASQVTVLLDQGGTAKLHLDEIELIPKPDERPPAAQPPQ